MTRRPEHRGVALGPASVAVRGGILVVVGLELDDRAPDAVDQERGADQLLGDLVHVTSEEITLDHGSTFAR